MNTGVGHRPLSIRKAMLAASLTGNNVWTAFLLTVFAEWHLRQTVFLTCAQPALSIPV